MIKNITKILGSEGVYASTNHFYRLLILNLWFGIMLLPWTLLNAIIKITPVTFVFYSIGMIWVLMNIQTIFQLFKPIIENEKTLRFREYWQQLTRNLKSKFIYSLLATIGLTILYAETYVIIRVSSLNYLAPLFFILTSFLTVSVLLAIYLNTNDQVGIKERIKWSVLMAWRHPLRTIVYFLILTLWASIGYWIPIVNLLIGNVVCFYLLHFLLTKYTSKLLKKYGIASH